MLVQWVPFCLETRRATDLDRPDEQESLGTVALKAVGSMGPYPG